MRYFIHLGYDGSKYSGWQRQPKSRTIQEVIEKSLFRIFKKDVPVFGCGRTDTGVHASQYALHINLDAAPQFDLKFRMNKSLPDDIAIFEIIEAKEKQHARYDATLRSYDYFIHWKKDPALFRYSLFYEYSTLDFDLMRKAVAIILNTKDFRPLCKQPDLYKNTLCKIKDCKLFVNEELGRLRFSITSNRFLRGMIRYCVYFLLEVGSGQMTLEDFEQIMNQENTLVKKRPVQPNGLFLSQVEYPFLELKDSHHLIKILKIGLE
ncbi:MAG: tRNA pseudouridine(38-40) synthase TruA [Aureispira sp.]|nr:tRNA pseudouridine(38-40) synthase TruA [Aureispira sp.]